MGRCLLMLFVLNVFLSFSTSGQTYNRPNVVLIITDDQGYGDLGFHGNALIRTPNLDALAQESVRFTNFYVSPVCAPTRSSLMTGRYSLRTGVRDTYNGGAIMATSEVTIAEILKDANYRTGMFGKWHLGDNYPSRPIDQGFDESVYHLAGGMGQVGDITTYFQYDSSYFDPILWYNGKQKKYAGYCSDIFTTSALDFIETNKDGPFFCYLSFNAPHTPLQVPDEYYETYQDADPGSIFESPDEKSVSEKDKEDARNVYAMVTNIDENVGRLLKKLEDLNISENTLVIFMTDNGPQQLRYNGGMRGLKGTVYEGGIRVPFFLHYPERFSSNLEIETAAAHIDLLPTLAEICGAEIPQDRMIDGHSLLPLLESENSDWQERSLFSYWTRRYPERYSNIALHKGDYKLVGNTDFNAPIDAFELFNLKTDPAEQINLVQESRAIAISMKSELDSTYQSLINSENLLDGPRIMIGSVHENPVILSRNDADGQRGIWAQEEVFGKWRVAIQPGRYIFRYKFLKEIAPDGAMILETHTVVNRQYNPASTDLIEMQNVELPAMQCDLIPFYAIKGKRILPFWVEVERID